MWITRRYFCDCVLWEDISPIANREEREGGEGNRSADNRVDSMPGGTMCAHINIFTFIYLFVFSRFPLAI